MVSLLVAQILHVTLELFVYLLLALLPVVLLVAHNVNVQAEDFQAVRLVLLFQLAMMVVITVVHQEFLMHVIPHSMNALAVPMKISVQMDKLLLVQTHHSHLPARTEHQHVVYQAVQYAQMILSDATLVHLLLAVPRVLLLPVQVVVIATVACLFVLLIVIRVVKILLRVLSAEQVVLFVVMVLFVQLMSSV